MANFKTAELKYFYYMILKRFRKIKLINRINLKNMLKNIELPDNPLKNHEIFCQELNIWGCGTVEVTWNIEKLLQYEPHDCDYRYYTVKELKELVDFDAPQTKEVLKEIKSGLISQHKKEYIVLSMLPGFPQFVIIDGNHRVLEKTDDLDYTFKCFVLEDERVLDFLEPNSKQFVETIYWIDSIIQKEDYFV